MSGYVWRARERAALDRADQAWQESRERSQQAAMEALGEVIAVLATAMGYSLPLRREQP